MNEEEKETKKWSLRKKLVIGAGVGLMVGTAAVGGAVKILTHSCISTRESRALADFSAIEAALVMYEAKSQCLPTTEQGLKALVEKPTTVPIPRNWGMQMRQVPHDPWGTEYGYRHVAELRRFLLISAGPDRQFDTEDDLTSNTE
ncbi:MAG: type II secretion system protein GspG [Verrucomicrobia bacterium]|nr:type II secretion system protein GspG [Verrucomicrobiota bacterium]